MLTRGRYEGAFSISLRRKVEGTGRYGWLAAHRHLPTALIHAHRVQSQVSADATLPFAILRDNQDLSPKVKVSLGSSFHPLSFHMTTVFFGAEKLPNLSPSRLLAQG